jgi:hypothetical protein
VISLTVGVNVMGRYRDNTARKEDWDMMATPVQGTASQGSAGTARAPIRRSTDLRDDRIMSDIETEVANERAERGVKPLMERILQSRGVAPFSLLAFLLLFFFLSPFLPTGVREYIAALLR